MTPIGIRTAAGAPQESASESAKKTRKKRRSRSRVGPWASRVRPWVAALAVEVGEEADQAHRQRREQERRADDRADRDVFAAFGAADQGDDRDQRLRHRGPDRGEDAADRAFAELQPVAEPLDRVGEEQRAGEDDGEADRQQEVRSRRGYSSSVHFCRSAAEWAPLTHSA